jgi:hypothetical protein
MSSYTRAHIFGHKYAGGIILEVHVVIQYVVAGHTVAIIARNTKIFDRVTGSSLLVRNRNGIWMSLS